MKAWRIVSPSYATSALDGLGAALYPGRWNHAGTRMVYLAESLALAVLETLVHMDISQAPAESRTILVEIPDDLPYTLLAENQLPGDWDAIPGPESLKDIGTQWAQAGREAILIVPSAVVRQEHLVLLNPLHPDATRITHQAPEAFSYDQRLRPVAGQPIKRKPSKKP
jgi:RES domain-containing protein